MKISVKNFGPIKEAKDIEIKPLTVFAGPSNTGKTYLATLFHSLLKINLEMAERSASYRGMLSIRGFIKDEHFYDLLISVNINKKKLDIISRKINSVIFPAMMKTNQSLWKEEMLRCFGEAGNALLKRKIECLVSDDEGKYLLNINSPEDSWTTASFDLPLEEFWEKIKDGKYHPYIYGFIDFVISKIHRDISNPYAGNIYYLPAIRGGIMQSHRGLASAAVRQAPTVGIRQNQTIPMFNGVLADYLERLLMVNQQRKYRRPDKRNDEFSKIDNYLEEHILKGKINIQDTETQYPEFSYSFANGKAQRDISLTQSSSMVSELAPLSLFIRYYLQKGDTLIFEEPEAHLHPEAQRAISEVIVMLVKAGVCVIVTTHSDYILEQLGNFAHAGDMPEEKRKDVELLGKSIKGRAFLDPEDVAMYSFQQKPLGTYVTRLPYDSESGIIPKDHEKESMALYNETVDLLNKKNGDE